MTITAPSKSKRSVKSRNTKAVSLSDFQADVKRFADRCSQCPDRDLADSYSAGLRAVMDRHAPLVTRCVSHRRSAPWLTDEVREARRGRRQAERRWRSTRLTVHREIFVKERTTVKRCLRDARSKIDISSTTKQLFAVSDILLGKAKTTSLPSNIPIADLPQRFCDFFVTKIKQIREDLDSCPHDPPSFFKFDGPQLSMFEPVTEELICRLISQSPTKSCTLDPIPATLTKQCLHDLAPLVTRIVNVSLSTGTVPSGLKQALVKPILKKQGLDANDLRNFRPVSNLSFVSKILERVVLLQLQSHLCANSLLKIRQSAYRKYHSTETAVLSALEGLLTKSDQKLVSVLALLDLSAAFDTRDYAILLRRLESTFGISGADGCLGSSHT